MQLSTMQCQVYIQSTSNFNQDFYIRPPYKPILLLGGSSNSIIKVIKPLHDMPKISTNRFTTYYPHYKEKPEIIEAIYNLFPFRPPPKLVSLPGVLFDCFVKVIAIYHPHYKDKHFSNVTQTFVYNTKLSL